MQQTGALAVEGHQEEKIIATLIRRIFAAPEEPEREPFAVWLASANGEEFRAAGSVADWGEPGDEVALVGTWVDDPRYGRQFHATVVLPHLPVDVRGLARWFARQPGVGPATARRVAAAVAGGGIERLLDDPSLLDQIADLNRAQKDAVRRALALYREHREREQVIIWCRQHGLGAAQAEAVFRAYGEDAPRILTADPWRLARLDRFGFLTADALAQQLGAPADGDQRLMAAVIYTLEQAAASGGHVFLPAGEVVLQTFQLLKETAKSRGYGVGLGEQIYRRLPAAVQALEQDSYIVLESDRVYLPRLWLAERTVWRWLERRAGMPGILGGAQAAELVGNPVIRGHMDDVQASAVMDALTHGASILTGGPGTGKTTVTRSLLKALRRIQEPFIPLLAAPTGRASKRMAEVTGVAAKTIHRLLEFHPVMGDFQRNADNPLDGSFLIVDETSMADLPLFAALVRAVPDDMPVLLVGDADQLPPVGPGAPFQEIIRQGLLPVARLERIYRQGEGSAIAINARRVNAGETPGPITGDKSYRQTTYPRAPRNLPGPAREQANRELRIRMADDTVDAVKEYLKAGWQPSDIQVLCATRRGALGVAELNRRLREILNPDGRHKGVFSTRSGREFWVGDRVMHVRNDYHKGVFNGESGRVVEVNVPVAVDSRGVVVLSEDGGPGTRQEIGLIVEFEDGSGVRRVPYYAGDIGDLELSYAITVHKSQGGEFPVVVFALGWDSYLLLKRNLVYTAITRAREAVVVLAEEGAVEQAVRSVDVAQRYQNLLPRRG